MALVKTKGRTIRKVKGGGGGFLSSRIFFLSSNSWLGGAFHSSQKFRKFRLVHQTERTVSVWSDRNIRDQLRRWFTVTGLAISVGRTEMCLSICQNCCPQYRSFVSCLQEQLVSIGKSTTVSKAITSQIV